MRDQEMTDRPVMHRPVMHWVPVVDEHGRTHMEARWTVEPQTSAPAHKPHAA
jgi:hypothetical protein